MTEKTASPEDEFFARQDAEKKRKLALEAQRALEAGEKQRLKELHYMHCPKCGSKLETLDYRGLQIDRCFACNGTWLDAGELEALAGKEPGLLQKFVSVFHGK